MFDCVSYPFFSLNLTLDIPKKIFQKSRQLTQKLLLVQVLELWMCSFAFCCQLQNTADEPFDCTEKGACWWIWPLAQQWFLRRSRLDGVEIYTPEDERLVHLRIHPPPAIAGWKPSRCFHGLIQDPAIPACYVSWDLHERLRPSLKGIRPGILDRSFVELPGRVILSLRLFQLFFFERIWKYQFLLSLGILAHRTWEWFHGT